MGIQLKSIALTSDQILRELISDSLPHILGAGCTVVSNDLPFDGNHLLCLDADRRPVLVTFDARDGGRALLAALAAIEGLSDNRGMLYRLYPALFQRDPPHRGAVFRSEDLRLVVLSPQAPPAAAYLAHAFPALSAQTFRILEVDGDIGVLIEPALRGTVPAGAVPPETSAPFRSGPESVVELTAQEERHFEDA
ncbi:MAG: hypothetical protein AB7Q01_01285 [Gammaproteobacteria bacterium]